MSTDGSEWISTELVDVAIHVPGRPPTPARYMVGLVRVDGGVVMLAVQLVGDDRPTIVLSPSAAAAVIGAIRRGLRNI